MLNSICSVIPGRAPGQRRDGDLHGRVEERQAHGVRHQRAQRRAALRGGVVRQQEVRLRRDHLPRRHQGGGQVQEQRAHHQPEEAPPLPHPQRQVPRADRRRGQRRAAGLQDRPAKSGHCYFKVNCALHYSYTATVHNSNCFIRDAKYLKPPLLISGQNGLKNFVICSLIKLC